MIYNLHIMGMCLLVFAIVVYITNFKSMNKYFIWQWKTIIENGRNIFYAETHPKGSYEVYRNDEKNFHYKQMIKQHGRFVKNFHRRMMKPNKLVRE